MGEEARGGEQQCEGPAEHQRRAEQIMLGLPQAVGHRAVRQAEHGNIEVDRPVPEDQRHQHRGGGHGGERRVAPPGYGDRGGDQDHEQSERERVVAGGQHQNHRHEQVSGKRAGRHKVDLARRGVGSEEQTRDDQQCGKGEAGGDMENMRREGRELADPRQGPQYARGDRGDGKPAPQSGPGEREGGGGDHGKIEIERPVARLLGRDDQRRDERADHAEPGERRTMQQRRGKREQRHGAEQHEGNGRTDQAVDRVRGISVGIGDGRAGGREHARDMRLGQAGDAGQDLVAPGPFPGGNQSERQQGAEQHLDDRAEPALLDRLPDEKEAAQRQRDAAGPDHPLRAEALFEADLGRGWDDGRGRRWRDFRLRRRWRFLDGDLRRFGCGRGQRLRCRRGEIAAPLGKPGFEAGKTEFEPLDPFPRADRHDDGDDGEHRNGENERDDECRTCPSRWLADEADRGAGTAGFLAADVGDQRDDAVGVFGNAEHIGLAAGLGEIAGGEIQQSRGPCGGTSVIWKKMA